jgi:HK97 family phage major capsid protein
LRGYINDFLMWGLLDVLNDQIINGTGTTPQLQGIDDLSNTQAQAFSVNILETTRRARTLVKVTGGAMPTAYVMNPLDWEDIDLLQDNEARYMFGGPQRMGTPVLWGLPVVEDEAVTEGLAFVGDWRMGIIWDREQARILMTDSHSDYFIRNILTLLAEMRVAIGWLRPAAFVEIDLTA